MIYRNSVILFFALFVFILFNSLKFNVAQNYVIKKTMNNVLPQAFGFFTRSPREFQYKFYRKINGNFCLIDLRNCQWSTIFGLRRINRMKGREFDMLRLKANSTKDTIFYKKDSFLTYNVRFKKTAIMVVDTGLYLVEKSQPISWAWINDVSEDNKPKVFAYIKFNYE